MRTAAYMRTPSVGDLGDAKRGSGALRSAPGGEVMRPILFAVFGFPIQSYGVSKALAAIIGAWLLGRAFVRNGLL